MKKLSISLLALSLLLPQAALAAGKADIIDHIVAANYQEIEWTLTTNSSQSFANQLCQVISKAAVQYNESDLNFIIRVQAKGNETAMEELFISNQSAKSTSCTQEVKQAVSAYVAFAPLKPAEFIKAPTTTKLDGTSMATPAITPKTVHPSKTSKYGDHIGAYNFQIEIEGINAGR